MDLPMAVHVQQRIRPFKKMQHRQVRRPILRDEERNGQENREQFLAAKNLPKNSFQKSGEAVDFQEANPLISTHQPFPEAGSRAFGPAS
jgi:hypothetical protein